MHHTGARTPNLKKKPLVPQKKREREGERERGRERERERESNIGSNRG
jgi:hypothetical protein